MTEDALAAAVDAANRAADESAKAREESKATRESVDLATKERQRNTKWTRIAVAVGLIMLALGGVSSCQSWRTSGGVADAAVRLVHIADEQAAAQVRDADAREASREILRTLLSYSDPESDVAKRGKEQQAAVIAGLLSEMKRVVDDGVSRTAVIAVCRLAADREGADLVACLGENGITLPSPTPTPVP